MLNDSVTASLDKGIQSCTSCELHRLPINRDQGKLLGFGKFGKLMIVGLNPSVRRLNSIVYNITPNAPENTGAWYLWKVIEELKLDTTELYITNLVKCSTPDNRQPELAEYKMCTERWFYQELFMSVPIVIICLGEAVYKFMDDKFMDDSKVKKFISIEQVYHPAFIARTPQKYPEWLEQWQQLIRKNVNIKTLKEVVK